MPELSTNKGRTASCRPLQIYLDGKDSSRPLARDFINIVERDGEGRGWAEIMDETRREHHNDAAWKGKAARTFMHYVVSPDPADEVGLETMRELAVAWAQRFFGDYEVAIVYHDDNENGVLHAHVVVNNTNLTDGHRLSSDLTDARVALQNRELQEMSLERGLRAFTADHVSMTAEEMEAAGKAPAGREAPAARGRAQERTGFAAPRAARRASPREERRRDKAQRGAGGMDSRAGYVSWKTEVQDRVDVARAMARGEREFRSVLASMGVTVTVNRKGDYVYGHPMGGAKRVTGARLGAAYTRRAVRRGIELGYSDWLKRSASSPSGAARRRAAAALTDEQVERVAASLRVSTSRGVSDSVRAADVVALLDYNSRHGIRSQGGYGADAEARRMAALSARLGLFDGTSGRATARAREDALLVGAWLREKRSGEGSGGREAGAAEAQAAARDQHPGRAQGGAERGKRPDREKGK